MRVLWIFVAVGALGLIGSIFGADKGGSSLTGAVAVIDGDTLRLGSTRVRLSGIDAPERAQTCVDEVGIRFACGAEATEFLSGLINGQSVSCSDGGTDRYGRTLGVCHAGDTNLNKQMVLKGWAVAAYGNQYLPEQMVASVSGRGLWAGEFQNPAEYRHSR